MGGFPFGVDSNGNPGYRKPGADTVTPFNNLASIVSEYKSVVNRKTGNDPINLNVTVTKDCIVFAGVSSKINLNCGPWIIKHNDKLIASGNTGQDIGYAINAKKGDTISVRATDLQNAYDQIGFIFYI